MVESKLAVEKPANILNLKNL